MGVSFLFRFRLVVEDVDVSVADLQEVDVAGDKVARKVIWVVPWRTQGWKVLLGIGVLVFVIWKRRNFGRAWYALRTGKPPPEDY